MKTYFVYILLCYDGTYYTGITSDIIKRIKEHSNGKHIDSYTYNRRPVKLAFLCEFSDVKLAIAKEKQIKKWSKKKKEALINNAFEGLPNLAKKSFRNE